MRYRHIYWQLIDAVEDIDRSDESWCGHKYRCENRYQRAFLQPVIENYFGCEAHAWAPFSQRLRLIKQNQTSVQIYESNKNQAQIYNNCDQQLQLLAVFGMTCYYKLTDA